ncbi:MAG: hypothetical protein WDO13_06245 [Verrucomicrobiota bacterium]
MQILESDVRALRPWLHRRQLSLSEYVRALILENRRRFIRGDSMPLAMIEIR